ncbi:MAG: TRAP transporter substrate-binding protein [Synergistaceae bacterium]|nr:TRAP transporter substrate-binding protein [Synergistaceae bacterium]
MKAFPRSGVFLLAAVFALTVFATVASAKTTLTAHSVYSDAHYQVQGLKMMAERVKELTGGSLELNVISGGALGYKGPDLLRVVKEGQLDISEIVSTGLTGSNQIFGVRSLPMLINGWDEAELFNKVARPYYETICDEWNQKLLVVSSWPFADLWTTKGAEKAEDLKGLKVRTYDRSGALFVEAFGGTPLALPLAELYTAFSTGLVQGTISSAVSARESNIYEVTKYCIPLQVTTSSSITTINRDAWNKLTPAEQEALTQAAAETEAWLASRVREVVDEDMAAIKAKKPDFQFSELSPEFRAELEAIGAKVAADFIEKNPEAKALYEAFLSAKGK